eukprot:g17103.t1
MSRAPLTAEVTATALDCPTHPATKPVACLPQFHLLLYCNSYFSSVFFVATFALLLYKKAVLDYAAGVVEGEAALLFLYLPVQGSRYFFGSSAYGFDNAMKRNNYLLVFGLLTLPLLMFHGYWMQNQLGAGAIGASRADRDAFLSYVLRVDEALNAVTIGLLLVELVLGMIEALLVLPASRLDEVSCIIRITVLALNASVLTLTLAVGQEMLPDKTVPTVSGGR